MRSIDRNRLIEITVLNCDKRNSNNICYHFCTKHCNKIQNKNNKSPNGDA